MHRYSVIMRCYAVKKLQNKINSDTYERLDGLGCVAVFTWYRSKSFKRSKVNNQSLNRIQRKSLRFISTAIETQIDVLFNSKVTTVQSFPIKS